MSDEVPARDVAAGEESEQTRSTDEVPARNVAADDRAQPTASRLVVDEAMKKAAVAWVAAPGGPALALWCVPIDGALYVVSGPGEQSAPGLAGATAATVMLRGDHGGQIVTWTAEVTRVTPGSEEWAAAAPQVAGKRLNAPGNATELVERWSRECTLNRLAPADGPLASGDALPDGSLAAPPRETPAVRQTRKPFRLHRVRRR